MRVIGDADCVDSLVVTGGPARALWRVREDGAGLGGRTPAGAPAWPGWEDAAVPPQHLGAYLRDFGALMREHGLDGLIYGHFGDGCVHVRIDFPLAARPEDTGSSSSPRRGWWASTAARCRGSTGMAGRAANCSATCTHPRPSARSPR